MASTGKPATTTRHVRVNAQRMIALRPVGRVVRSPIAGVPVSFAPQRWRLAVAPGDEVQTSTDVKVAESETATTTEAANGNGNGNGTATPAPAPINLDLTYEAPSDSEAWWTKTKLAFAWLWRRIPNKSVLTIKLEGELPDQAKGFFEPGNSLPQLCSALQRAALDPRITGLAIEIGPLAVGYAKLQELRRYMDYFRASGKFMVAYMKQGGEKEYYVASACKEIYVPPTASLLLRGFVVGGTFLRGVLDKIGVEPQVQRIGEYKSAGDQLLRTTMSDAQREQLTAILDDTYTDWVSTIAKSRGKTEQEVRDLLDSGLYDAKDYLEGGWVDGLRYEDELLLDLKKRTGIEEDKIEKKPLKKVGIRKVNAVGASAYGPILAGGKKRVVVLRTSGAILGKSSSGVSSSITPEVLIPRLRALAKDKNVAGVVLRVDSPGGDALASDLMWREVIKLGEKKPVIASMADVAASGGYYISMAAHKIVAEPLTVTGSIGVVTGKFNLQELYSKIGYAKTLLSKGRYAELLADQRPFTEDELSLFEKSAFNAYESFRNKAAASRKLSVEAMQAVAQGRVWTGRAALDIGLVDALGGVHTAIQLVKQAAGLKEDEKVTVVEAGTGRSSPLALLRGATVASLLPGMASGNGLAAVGLLVASLLSGTGTAATSAPLGSDGIMAARVAGAGLAISIGSTAAAAVAVAATACSSTGVTLAVEPEALGVQAAGSTAVAEAASMEGRGLQASDSLWHAPWDDEMFLNE